MSQVTLIGTIVGSQALFDNGSFKKQTLLISVVDGQYTNFYPIDFIQNRIDTLLPQVQMGGTYQFTGYLRGSRNQMTDKLGQPTAYLNLDITAVAPAQVQLPPTSPITAPQPQFGQPAQSFGAPQQQSQPVQQQQFGQPQQGGFVGQPAPTQGFGNPQPTGFGQPAQAVQGQGSPFGQPAQGFGTPQQ